MDMSQNAPEGGKSRSQSENEKIGKVAEESFANLLNSKNIPYYYIDQSKESFSKKLNIEFIKRPDYIIYTKNYIFHVDVKYRKKQQFGSIKEERFYLSQKDIEELFNFHNKLLSDTWIAFTNNENSMNFFYAPIQKIYDYYIFITDGINKERSNTEDTKEFDRFYSTRFCPILIPQTFLYNGLSFERGFYKEPDCDFSEADIKDHLDNAKKIPQTIPYKNNETDGHCIGCDRPIPYNKKKPLCEQCYEEKTEYFFDYCHNCGSKELFTISCPLCDPCYEKICKNIRWGAR
jgi:Holliday junction resolvase